MARKTCPELVYVHPRSFILGTDKGRMDFGMHQAFSPDGKTEFRKPRGLRFAANGLLCSVARDEVVPFDFGVANAGGYRIAEVKWTSCTVFS
jgi:hypothetical protein